ncbi:TIGR03089 family protein [Arthrobacter sp. SDTb3-6]|uniref:TIGR03089 family protein n=1 Tax=Arthrobacter sp. SDTb3-6 TaxID=2713571 RepID=UPI00159DD4D1|nr:TIGR03089 family protein [Arthrobacter sp. SDTb3-6]NVM99321.1 TIGR03089 family protein [Arthrobacter sp. SDTb3-6]
MAQIPSTVPQFLNALRTLNPTAPRLTWYGPDSERVELSGRVLDNWVAKTANFLADELDAGPGTVVALDLPVHWRSFVWLLATWAVGATAVAGGAGDGAGDGDAGEGADGGNVPLGFGRADIVATTDPVAAAASITAARAALTAEGGSGPAGPNPLLVAVALPALAMRWTGALPDGAVDYSGEVRAHADVHFPDDEPAGDDPAWETSAGTATFAQLLPAPTEGPDATGQDATGPQRVLLEARNGWDGVVHEALATWAHGGSIVLLGPSAEATDRLRATENVTCG